MSFQEQGHGAAVRTAPTGLCLLGCPRARARPEASLRFSLWPGMMRRGKGDAGQSTLPSRHPEVAAEGMTVGSRVRPQGTLVHPGTALLLLVTRQRGQRGVCPGPAAPHTSELRAVGRPSPRTPQLRKLPGEMTADGAVSPSPGCVLPPSREHTPSHERPQDAWGGRAQRLETDRIQHSNRIHLFIDFDIKPLHSSNCRNENRTRLLKVIK